MLRTVIVFLCLACPVAVQAAWNWMPETLSEDQQTRSTTWQPGYVTPLGGKQKKGEIYLTLVNGEFTQLHYRKSSKKKRETVYLENELNDHGLLMNVVANSDESNPRNFYRGTVKLRNNRFHSGWVAIKDEDHIARAQEAVAYLSSAEAKISSFPAEQIKEVMQFANGQQKFLLVTGNHFTEKPIQSVFDHNVLDFARLATALTWGKWTTTTPYGRRRVSKWNDGFVVLTDGTQLRGRICAERIGYSTAVSTVYISIGGKTLTYPVEELQTYGMLELVEDLPQSFHQGWVETYDGKRVEGLWALDDQGGMLFAENRTAFVKSLDPSRIMNAVRSIDGREESWQGLWNKFIPRPELAKLESKRSKKKYKELQTGWIVLHDGTRIDGRLSRKFYEGKGLGINFVNNAGWVHSYSNQLQSFVQVIEGVEQQFLNFGGRFTEIEEKGAAYMLFKNPFPTTIDYDAIEARERLERLIVKNLQQLRTDYAEDRVRTKIESEIANGADPLTAAAAGIKAGEKATRGTFYPNVPNPMPQVTYAPRVPEYVVRATPSNLEVIVREDNVSEVMKPLVADCSLYQGLKKKEQRKLMRFKSMDKLVSLMNRCAAP